MKTKYPLLLENNPEIKLLKAKIKRARIKSALFSLPFLIPLLMAYVPLFPEYLFYFLMLGVFCFTMLYQLIFSQWLGKEFASMLAKNFKPYVDPGPSLTTQGINAANGYNSNLPFQTPYKQKTDDHSPSRTTNPYVE